MSRSEWILGGVLAILLVVVAGVLFWFWRQDQVIINQATGDSTAKQAYQAAHVIAREWASDAQLISANTSWNVTGDLKNISRLGWSFVFYSPSQSATALVSVANRRAVLINSRQTSQQFAPVDDSEWQVDSDVIVQELLGRTEETFLLNMTEGKILLNLTLLDELTWKGTLLNQDRRSFSVKLNATDGTFIEIQQSS